MKDDKAAVSPRRLVVAFYDYSYAWPDPMNRLIQDDQGNRPQLVHVQRILPLPSPSRIDRFFLRLRIKPPPSKALKEVNRLNYQAIADAHRFVSGHYRSGDQVILVAGQGYDGDHHTKWMGIFAQHLYDGTTPVEPFRARFGGGKNDPGRRIPIYAISVVDEWCNTSPESISLFNDWLKSRFPPGVIHIMCSRQSGSEHWNCSTTFDLDGSIISREISMYDEEYSNIDILTFSSKGIIYYTPLPCLNWDKQVPVWTKVLHSSPSGVPRNLSRSRLPAGTYQQELSRYQGGSKYSDRLVWKSFRH